MNRIKIREALKETMKLVLLADTVMGGNKVNVLLPLLTLTTQEIQLQRMRTAGQNPHDEDVERMGEEVHQVQLNPMSYPLIYMAMEFGYLMATHPDELLSTATKLEDALRIQRESTTLQ